MTVVFQQQNISNQCCSNYILNNHDRGVLAAMFEVTFNQEQAQNNWCTQSVSS